MKKKLALTVCMVLIDSDFSDEESPELAMINSETPIEERTLKNNCFLWF